MKTHFIAAFMVLWSAVAAGQESESSYVYEATVGSELNLVLRENPTPTEANENILRSARLIYVYLELGTSYQVCTKNLAPKHAQPVTTEQEATSVPTEARYPFTFIFPGIVQDIDSIYELSHENLAQVAGPDHIFAPCYAFTAGMSGGHTFMLSVLDWLGREEPQNEILPVSFSINALPPESSPSR